MSRSRRKHRLLKFDGGSWSIGKAIANRHNRSVAKQILRNGGDIFPKDRMLCAWDSEYFKFYYTKEEERKYYKYRRK